MSGLKTFTDMFISPGWFLLLEHTISKNSPVNVNIFKDFLSAAYLSES